MSKAQEIYHNTSSDLFKMAMANYASSVAVVTVAHQGVICGITINSFTSVSLQPPSVLWCLQNSNSMKEYYLSATHFSVSILAGNQKNLATHFSKHVEGVSNVAGYVTDKPDKFGTYGIKDCLSRIVCRLSKVVEQGDHSVIFGSVEQTENYNENPALCYWRRKYFNTL